MVNITLNTNTGRRNVISDVNATLASIFEDNDLNTQGAIIHLDGRPVSMGDAGKSLAALGVADEGRAVLSLVVKATSAC